MQMEQRVFVGDGPWKFTPMAQITEEQIVSITADKITEGCISASQISTNGLWIKSYKPPTWIERKWARLKYCWWLLKRA